MEIDYDYFFEEYHRFRKIMGSTNYTIEQRERAFEGLATVYLTGEFGDRTKDAIWLFKLAKGEYDRRMVHLLMKEIR